MVLFGVKLQFITPYWIILKLRKILFLLALEMFQSELSLELDRILKSQLLNQTRSVSGPAEISVSGNPVESGFEVIAKEHDDSTRFPSDVLIDIKDMVKLVILKNVSPEKIAVKNLLVETKTILEKRQVSSEKFHINFDT